MSLDFMSMWGNREKIFLKFKVRVEAILKCLIIAVISTTMPGPLIKYLKDLTTPKNYLPRNFLWGFEKRRIETDSRGSILNIDKEGTLLIYAVFLIGKVLIDQILMKPQKIVMVWTYLTSRKNWQKSHPKTSSCYPQCCTMHLWIYSLKLIQRIRKSRWERS
jgi:hypothetical protein